MVDCIREGEKSLIVCSEDDKAVVMDDDVDGFFLKTHTSDLKVVEDIDFSRMQFRDIDFIFFIETDDHTLLSGSKEEDFRLMLNKLAYHSQQKFVLCDDLKQGRIFIGILLLDFLLNILVYVYILPLRTDQMVVEDNVVLDSVLELKHISAFKDKVVKQVLLDFVF